MDSLDNSVAAILISDLNKDISQPCRIFMLKLHEILEFWVLDQWFQWVNIVPVFRNSARKTQNQSLISVLFKKIVPNS